MKRVISYVVCWNDPDNIRSYVISDERGHFMAYECKTRIVHWPIIMTRREFKPVYSFRPHFSSYFSQFNKCVDCGMVVDKYHAAEWRTSDNSPLCYRCGDIYWSRLADDWDGEYSEEDF